MISAHSGEQVMKRIMKSTIAVPLITIIVVVSYSSYALYAQSTMTEHSEDIIRLLLYTICVIGGAAITLGSFAIRRVLSDVADLKKDVQKVKDHAQRIDVRCAAFTHSLPESNLGIITEKTNG